MSVQERHKIFECYTYMLDYCNTQAGCGIKFLKTFVVNVCYSTFTPINLVSEAGYAR